MMGVDFDELADVQRRAAPDGELDAGRLLADGDVERSDGVLPQPVDGGRRVLLTRRYGIRGYATSVHTACASGGQALGTAMKLIRRGAADRVLAGGFDSMISPVGLRGFCLLSAVSPDNDTPERASRPFDATRNGFVLGEGAGFLVLEEWEAARRRGAHIYAELAGDGNSLSSYRITDSPPVGDGPIQAMRQALADAGAPPDDVDYLNAHGTSTPMNDRSESAAIERRVRRRREAGGRQLDEERDGPPDRRGRRGGGGGVRARDPARRDAGQREPARARSRLRPRHRSRRAAAAGACASRCRTRSASAARTAASPSATRRRSTAGRRSQRVSRDDAHRRHRHRRDLRCGQDAGRDPRRGARGPLGDRADRAVGRVAAGQCSARRRSPTSTRARSSSDRKLLQAHPAHRRRSASMPPGRRSTRRASSRIATRSTPRRRHAFNDAPASTSAPAAAPTRTSTITFRCWRSRRRACPRSGASSARRVNPMWLLRTLPNNVLCHVGIRHGLKGPNACITNHSIGGALAVIEAARGAAQRRGRPRGRRGPRRADRAADGALLPRRGPADRGHAAAVRRGARAAACSAKAPARWCWRPRARRRARRRGARRDPRRRLHRRGAGTARDPRRRRRARARDPRSRSTTRGCGAADVGMIVAHGNGTPQSDASEARALRRCSAPMRRRSPPSSGRSDICSRPSGIIEAVLALGALRGARRPGHRDAAAARSGVRRRCRVRRRRRYRERRRAGALPRLRRHERRARGARRADRRWSTRGAANRCGIDTVEIARIERLLARDAGRGPREALLARRSSRDAGDGAGRAASLAARFAAKEACLKLFPRETALGADRAGGFLVDARQLRRAAGRLQPAARRRARPQPRAGDRALADARPRRARRRSRSRCRHARRCRSPGGCCIACCRSAAGSSSRTCAACSATTCRTRRSTRSRRRTTRISGGSRVEFLRLPLAIARREAPALVRVENVDAFATALARARACSC